MPTSSEYTTVPTSSEYILLTHVACFEVTVCTIWRAVTEVVGCDYVVDVEVRTILGKYWWLVTVDSGLIHGFDVRLASGRNSHVGYSGMSLNLLLRSTTDSLTYRCTF